MLSEEATCGIDPGAGKLCFVSVNGYSLQDYTGLELPAARPAPKLKIRVLALGIGRGQAMLIPLRHENMEGRRWPVISIALIVINLVAFLGTHWQIDAQNPKRSEIRAHILLLAGMPPELSTNPYVQDFVTRFR